jgi:hypothetical protein
MIVSTHLLDWSCKRANYGQHLGHLKNKNKICENKKILKNVERIFFVKINKKKIKEKKHNFP